jgi:hypothetical protein
VPPLSATTAALPAYERRDRGTTEEAGTAAPLQPSSGPLSVLPRLEYTPLSGSLDPWAKRGASASPSAIAPDVDALASERLSLVVRKHTAARLTTEEEARLQLLTYRLEGRIPDPHVEDTTQRLGARVRAVDDLVAEADRVLNLPHHR